MKQLDIYWVDLNPTRGFETQKKRPYVIVQSDRINRQSKTFVVAPLLPNHKPWPFAVNITKTKGNGLDGDRHLNLKQVRVVDESRFSNKQGKLSPQYLDEIHEALKLVLGID